MRRKFKSKLSKKIYVHSRARSHQERHFFLFIIFWKMQSLSCEKHSILLDQWMKTWFIWPFPVFYMKILKHQLISPSFPSKKGLWYSSPQKYLKNGCRLHFWEILELKRSYISRELLYYRVGYNSEMSELTGIDNSLWQTEKRIFLLVKLN